MSNANIQPTRRGPDNDDDFVVLGPEVKKSDFLQLVRAVYPRQYNKPENLSSDEWQAVLKLSETFALDDVRRKAASNLKDIFFAGDPVKALLCAKKNKLADWVAPLIDKIVQTDRELTDGEIGQLGIPLAMKIARAQGAAGIGERSPRSSTGMFDDFGDPIGGEWGTGSSSGGRRVPATNGGKKKKKSGRM